MTLDHSKSNGTPVSPRLVLVTMALADLDALDEIRAAAGRLGARVAALQGGGQEPLVRALDELAAEGDEPVRLVGITRSAPDTGSSWVRRVAGHWVRTRGTLQVEVAAGLQSHVESLDPAGLRWRAVTGREAPLHSPAWAAPPEHDHHVLVCRGPRCNALGAEATREALRAALARRGLLDGHVLTAQTGCLYPCNLAPVVVVHPAGTWHGPVCAQDVESFIDEHLAPHAE